MVDRGVLRSVVEASEIDPERDVVLEIGPGTGALSQYLMHTGVGLILLELDRGLHAYLNETYGHRVEVVHGDVLEKKRALHARVLELMEEAHAKGQRLKIVSNLPYNILTPFTWNLLSQPGRWDSGIFLVQREFADRLVAQPGVDAYSPLSVLAGLFLEVENVRKVPRGCFWPAPEVDSSIVKLTPKKEADPWSNDFAEIVKLGFSQRRKNLAKLLKARVAPPMLQGWLESQGMAPDARAESLAPEVWRLLYRETI